MKKVNVSDAPVRRAFLHSVATLRRRLLWMSGHLSLWGIVLRALCFRVALWLLLASVCAVLPSHNPGDDVVRFNLEPTSSEDVCFAQSDTFCACGFSCTWEDEPTCVDSPIAPPNWWQSHVYPFLLRPLTRWDAARFLRLALRPQIWHPHTNLPEESEKAHAFFPAFPVAVQGMARLLMAFVPPGALPSTCAGVLVLASALCNTLAFLIALVCLYKTTDLLFQRYGQGVDPEMRRVYTKCATLLFVLNPASVFFGTAYSESLFASMVFCGSYSMLRCGPWCALVPWTLAATVRSNGILYVGYLVLYAAGSLFKRPRKGAYIAFSCLFVGIVMVSPVYFYNRQVIAAHCTEELENQYEWCAIASSSPIFSLYAYIQRKHWNVGFLRYYELKQIPNFLLAAPLLCLSALGVSEWIYHSWCIVVSADSKPIPAQAFRWVGESLQNFVHPTGASSPRDILVGSAVLGHYAIWAVTAILGLTTAHVQISTRLLCSTCPALYWYAAFQVAHFEERGCIYLAFSVIFIIVGGVLHALWLPWT